MKLPAIHYMDTCGFQSMNTFIFYYKEQELGATRLSPPPPPPPPSFFMTDYDREFDAD